MIKFLLIAIFLVSCQPEVDYKNLSTSSATNSVEALEMLEFNPQIEMMILFLWPEDLGPEDEKEVVEIISTSRKISEDKERYLKNLYKLNIEYSQNNCDCHSFGLCDDEVEMDDEILLICDDISSNQASNNMILANLTLDHEFIKEKLAAIGAINIDVGVDDDYLDIGTYDTGSKILVLNKFGYLGQEKKIEFKIIPYLDLNPKAKFEFSLDGEVFKGDLGISNREHNVIYSGEIETSRGLRGLIYWEHLK